MQDFVSVVTMSNYNDFFEREKEIQKVLVFTDKKSTPAVFKALSKQYKGKLSFGHVRDSESQLIKNYKVTKFPSVILVTNPYDNEGVVFPGEDYSMKAFQDFFRPYAYGEKKKASKPTSMIELTETKMKQQGLCDEKDSNYCLILFLNSNT